MKMEKVKCSRCGQLVSVNILQVTTDGIVASCSRCGEITEISKAVEDKVYRFLKHCQFGAFGGKHDITRKN